MTATTLEKRMDKGLQAQVAARGLLLQSCWNYERMQNIGFAFAMEPWLRRIAGGDDPRLRKALSRHLEFFNTQPYMASFVCGVVGRLEEELAGQEEPSRIHRVASLKGAFGAALAGIGDALFWGALRPCCAALAVGTWLFLWASGQSHAALWAALVYLAAYNLPALWVRWHGVSFGYRWGEATSSELKRFQWQARIKNIRWIGFILALGLTAYSLAVPGWGPGQFWINASILAAALLARALGLATPRIYAYSIAAWTVVAFILGE